MEMETDKRQEHEHVQAGMAENHGNELHTEVDLSEREHDDAEEHAEEEHVDYSGYTKQQLAQTVKDLIREDNFKRVDHVLREVKPVFDEIRERERAEALSRFIADGGIAEDFDYKGDEHDISLDANFKLLKDRKTQHFRQQEERKVDNLRRKEELLEKLRELSDSLDTNNQFDAFKELQKEWKSIGAVPGAQAKTLWANYHALVDRFYDNQSIYYELKELDRRRNLESKLELCVRAEKLANVEIIKDAIHELNELHHEFKHIGPVPIEEKEAVWQRFKAASDAVYAKRDSYLQHLQQELQVNLENKQKLADEVQEFATYDSDRIKEWNQKTKEILDIQKRWEIVGGLPRAKAKDVNKKFWSAFKAFFNNKNNFFKKLDEERENNLQQKNALVEKALALKESSDWEKTSNDLKNLQQKWKDIGPVPEKFREKVFKEFKEACDYFFEQRRHQHGKVENEQSENLRQKEAICAELEQHAEQGTAAPNLLRTLQDKFNELGFVPRKDINTIRARYHAAVDKFVNAISGYNEDDKSRLLLENQISDLKNDPMADRKIYQKEQVIRKKISKIENDISLWKNNMEFFSRSSNAEKVKEEFNEKIREASDHLKQLKDQLKLLKTV
ncbi:MAG TPA: DUF349 domain-containing protein [Ohtaekwangia sp.]|nr:DUF349 domain-containing protein [Ohtaekwangia sp.]